MKTKLSDKTYRWSITNLTNEEYFMLQRCFDLIKEHTHFNEECGEYEIAAEDIVGCFDEEEYKVLQSIEL